MNGTMHCRFCRGELDLAQQFTYLVEVQTVRDAVMMAAIRRLPHCDGVPLRVCRACQAGIEQNRFVVRDTNTAARRAGRRGGQLLLLAALVGFGFVTARFGF